MVKLLLQDSLVPAPIWQILKQGQCDIMKIWIAYFTPPKCFIKIHQPTQVISPISPSPFLSSAPFLAKRQSAHTPIPPIFMRLIVVEIQTHQAWNGHTWMNQGWCYVESANLRVGDFVVLNILSFWRFHSAGHSEYEKNHIPIFAVKSWIPSNESTRGFSGRLLWTQRSHAATMDRINKIEKTFEKSWGVSK